MAQDSTRPLRLSRPSHRADARHGRPVVDHRRTNPPTDVEDEATIAYIKRVLCRKSLEPNATSHAASLELQTLEELLPPLTSSNTVDVELYALIAVILENLVQSWYNRITPDAEFTSEIVRIIAHATRALEQRLRHVDLESLLLDELPDLALKHIEAVRISRSAYGGSMSMAERRSRFHVLQPHMALYPPPGDTAATALQRENEEAWCQLLVNRILPLLLPPEDFQNPCLKVLTSEIVAEIIFRGGICGKASEGRLWWEGIANIISVVSQPPRPAFESPSSIDRLEQYGLLSSSAKPLDGVDARAGGRGRFDGITVVFWSVVQFGFLAWLFLRSAVNTLIEAQSLPGRSERSRGVQADPGAETASIEFDRRPAVTRKSQSERQLRPIVGMRIWTCVARLFELDERMPWLTGALSLAQWLSLHGPGQLCGTNGRVDRFLSAALHDHVLSNPTLLPVILSVSRRTLFPNNRLAIPAPRNPDEVEIAKERARARDACAAALVDLLPNFVRRRVFADSSPSSSGDDGDDARAGMRADCATTCLDLFDDDYVNERLVVAVVELVAVRLFPELLRRGGDEDLVGIV